MHTANAGELTRIPFTLLGDDSEPITGAVNGDFTARLYRRGVASAVVVTVAELAGGDYVASFTPDQSGDWYLGIDHGGTGRQFAADIAVGLGAVAQAVAIDEGTTVRVLAWLERNGRRDAGATAATVELFNSGGTSVGSVAMATPNAQGIFSGSFTPSPAIVENRLYTARATLTDPTGTVVTDHAVGAVAAGD